MYTSDGDKLTIPTDESGAGDGVDMKRSKKSEFEAGLPQLAKETAA